jgi:hypothetical protein
MKLQNPWSGRDVTVTRGDRKTETVSGPRFVLDTRWNEKLRLVPRGEDA